jgi:hypothetical protein
LPRLSPDFQHHDADRIAGQRVGGGPQRGIDIRRAHRHHTTRIEAEFGQPAHRQRAGFDFGEILPHPHQGPPCACTPCEASTPREAREPCDEPGRRGALPPLGEHFMHRGQGETALQRRIRLRMAERHTARRNAVRLRLDAFDAAAQSRKRVRACAGHAPLLRYLGRHLVQERTCGWLNCS